MDGPERAGWGAFSGSADCANVLIGGHIVLLNRRTNVVADFVHVELF